MVLLLRAELPIFHFPLVFQHYLNYASFHCWCVLKTLKAAPRGRREAGFALLQTLIRLISEVKLILSIPPGRSHPAVCAGGLWWVNKQQPQSHSDKGRVSGAAFRDALMRWSLKQTRKCLCQEHLRKLQLITDYNRQINGKEMISWALPWQFFPLPWKAGSLLTKNNLLSRNTNQEDRKNKPGPHFGWLASTGPSLCSYMNSAWKFISPRWKLTKKSWWITCFSNTKTATMSYLAIRMETSAHHVFVFKFLLMNTCSVCGCYQLSF